MLDYNIDEPAHPFRPYGATIGHWLEWARLALHLRAALGDDAPDWLLDDADSLFEAAVREGWAVDGTDGFVYTVDWEGRPVVRERMHWVAAEATAPAAALHPATGDPSYDDWYQVWWEHIDPCFRDPERGSWRHELSPDNEPSHHLAGEAGHLPRLPGHPHPAPAVGPDPGRGPARRRTYAGRVSEQLVVGFDLDMTLIDTVVGFAATLDVLGAELGVEFPTGR